MSLRGEEPSAVDAASVRQKSEMRNVTVWKGKGQVLHRSGRHAIPE